MKFLTFDINLSKNFHF